MQLVQVELTPVNCGYSCFTLKEVLWGEDRSLLCLVGLVHRHADPRRPGRPSGLPLWSLHNGFQPSQVCSSLTTLSHLKKQVVWLFFFAFSFYKTCSFLLLPVSKEICEANTTIMCPMCEDTCEPWTLSDSCVYAKVSVALRLAYKRQSFLSLVCGCALPIMPWI